MSTYGLHAIASPSGVSRRVNYGLDHTRTGQLDLSPTAQSIWGAVALGTAVLSTYHGYKRTNGSVGWTIGWTLFGAILPIVALPVMLAQGIGKRG